METSNDKKHTCPTTTVNEARLLIAQPTRSPIMVERWFENSFGKVRVKGKIGQVHMNVLSAIRFVGKPFVMQDGRTKLLVDMAQVRRVSGVTGGRLDDVLDDLMQVQIEVREPKHLACLGHLIDNIDKAQKADGSFVMARNPLGGERHLWRVTLGEAACRLKNTDLGMNYDPAPIARLKNGISQAVTRHLLTHKNEPNGGWLVDNLINTVGHIGSANSMRDKRHNLKEDEDGLREIGFELNAGRIRKIEQALLQGAIALPQGAIALLQGAKRCPKAR